MARALAIIKECETTEGGTINILIDTCIVPTNGETFLPFHGIFSANVIGDEGTASLNNKVEQAIISQALDLGITLTSTNIRHTKFS